MIKKTVTYKDIFTGEDKVEELYFHLSAAELLEMQIDKTTVVGEMINKLGERIKKAEDEGINLEDLEDFPDSDVPKLFQLIKTFVLNGYGQRSDNGSFKKSAELREQFAASEAYSSLILELGSDAEKGAEFINGMVPSDLAEQATKMASKATSQKERPLKAVESSRKITRKELIEMSQDDFVKIQDDIRLGNVEIIDETVPAS